MIPTVKCGHLVFSATYTRFAADSMADVSRALLWLTSCVDPESELINRCNRPGWTDDEAIAARMKARADALLLFAVDKPALVAAAHYAQALSEALLAEIASWARVDAYCAGRYTERDPERLRDAEVIHQLERGLAPKQQIPPFPAALQHAHLLASDWRMCEIAKTLSEATEAMSRGRSKSMKALHECTTRLSAWLAGNDRMEDSDG